MKKSTKPLFLQDMIRLHETGLIKTTVLGERAGTTKSNFVRYFSPRWRYRIERNAKLNERVRRQLYELYVVLKDILGIDE